MGMNGDGKAQEIASEVRNKPKTYKDIVNDDQGVIEEFTFTVPKSIVANIRGGASTHESTVNDNDSDALLGAQPS
jgi:hypothetical protein